MTRILTMVAASAAALSLSACATITRGTSQNYTIETSPSEAQVALSTGQTCTSPCKLKLARKTGFDVTATKEGYEAGKATVRSEFKGGGAAAGVGNVLLGGIVGVGVDASNGSMKDLTPNPLVITLVPVGGAAPAEAAPASSGGSSN